jgi:hypothetical protein
MEWRHRHPGHFYQFVCGLQGIEHGGQAQIENAVENKDIHAHGNNHIKNGVIANGESGVKSLGSNWADIANCDGAG